MTTVASDGYTIEVPSTAVSASGSIVAARARFFLYAGLGVAVFIRLVLTASTNFPLNDGGMFYVMIRNLQSSHYALPHFTSYNGMHIPYAYAPLAFYAAGVVAGVTHGNLFTILMLLPMLLSIATIGAFALLARSILRSSDAAAVAVVAFSFLPHSVLWQIMGGGLTRGFGLLFALLAMNQGYELFARHVLWRIAPTAIFASLTVLSHPKMAWFLVYSLALFVFWYGRNRKGLLSSSAVVVATAGLTAPWWATVIAYHGPAPFLASVRTGSISWGELISDALHLNISGEPFFPIIGLIAVLGIVWSIRSRQWFLIIWLAVMMPLDSREYLTDTLVPVSLFAGIGVVEILLPCLARIEGQLALRWKRWLSPLVMTCMLCYVALGLIAGCASTDVPLANQGRVAMAWVAQDTPSSSRFLIITGSPWWESDRPAEWFPALTGRMSVATVQGSEWLSTKPFAERVTEYNDAQACADQSTACLNRWATQTDTLFDYVYVSKTTPISVSYGIGGNGVDSPHHFALEYALKGDPNYTLVFENTVTAIFKRK